MTGLGVLRKTAKGSVILEWPNIFKALVCIKNVDARASTKHSKDCFIPAYVLPEHVGVFGVEDTYATRWVSSRFAVFKAISERANAAMQYFMNRQKTGEDALFAPGKWLSWHKTLFTAKHQGRRLAFDASRGTLFPPCVYLFEGDGPPYFTRASVRASRAHLKATQPSALAPKGRNQGVKTAKSRHASSSGGTKQVNNAGTNP